MPCCAQVCRTQENSSHRRRGFGRESKGKVTWEPLLSNRGRSKFIFTNSV
jgi:hypothetical protein